MQKPSAIFWLVVFLVIFSTAKIQAQDPIPIVTTLPVLKDLTEIIGQPHITVTTLISGFESEHTYTPKPSDLVAIQKARLLIKIGLGLELWVEGLINNADRPDLRIITTSKDIHLIEDAADAHDGHSDHDAGNPHIWLDPSNVKIMIQHIRDGLINIDPTHADDYRKNTLQYSEQLSQIETELIAKVAILKNKKIITHHPAWPYFAKRFGFIVKGNLLTQIGSNASAKKITGLIKKIKEEGIQVIVSEPQLSQKIPKILAEETGVRVVPLSPLPGAIPGTDHYIDLIRYNVEALVTALENE